MNNKYSLFVFGVKGANKLITVIKNGKAKRVYCPHCESLLEYEINDLMKGGSAGEFYYYLPCPVCDKEIVGNLF